MSVGVVDVFVVVLKYGGGVLEGGFWCGCEVDGDVVDVIFWNCNSDWF